MSPPPDDAAETRDRPSDDDSGDAPGVDATTRYWIVRKAVEDALMNVFWTIVSLALAVALLWFGVIAAIGAVDGSLLMIPIAVALLGLAVVTFAVALEVPLPFVGD
ncbi:hypothetical protein SAMN04488066_11243 [Halorubrum aquaticum]|uniref:Uncharacterized protein n=1 Tax=Halorubrum aquaticum TaxID=387340 RepID=A0A1I3BFT6_9EURY|nr:hypothetical protein [Halorubrum aquaticum]SFH61148.1 hypothetical protein SAMN04488066_11243 [Halorubrum aquaticum]